MKIYISYIILFLVVSQSIIAQPKPKQKEKEKAPTQKEMEELMKEAQKAMEEMDPEDKRMMDSLGIKMPSFKEVPKVGDAALKKAYDDEMRLVPLKDNARIASIYKFPITESNVATYLSSTNVSVVSKLDGAKKSQAEQAWQQAKTSYHSSQALGNAAVSFFMIGYPDIALYMMGKASLEDPFNTDNLNNYASMLSMCGGEQMAIPLLNSLNKKFPKNSTILNNLGQAWFGLGDIDKATKYLDTVIRMYRYHPQANQTQSKIDESKGQSSEAVEHMLNSIKHAYTKEKEDRLRKLGHKLNSKDIDWPFKKKADPLAFASFKRPPYPKNVDECISLEKIWDQFIEDIEKEGNRLGRQLKMAEETFQKLQQQRMQENISIVRASINAGAPQGELTVVPFFTAKAALKLNEIYSDKTGSLAFRMNEVLKKLASHEIIMVPNFQAYDRNIEILDSLDLEQTGEGLPNKDFCPKKKAVANELLLSYNPPKEQLYNEYLRLFRERMDEEMNYLQYTMWPDEYEVAKLKAKLAWLGLLKENGAKYITRYKCEIKPLNYKMGPLAEFDDVHCEYHSKLDLYGGSINVDCSRMTTKLDLGVFKGTLKQDMNKDTFKEQFMNCSVEVGISKSVGVERGPLKAEATAGATIGAEFDRKGLKDVVVKGGVGVSAGAGPATVEAGVEGTISIISGATTFEGNGILRK